MKENSELIRRNILGYFPAHQPKYQFSEILKKLAANCKNQLGNTLATAGIGTLFLVAIYLFFVQLAEYGWQCLP